MKYLCKFATTIYWWLLGVLCSSWASYVTYYILEPYNDWPLIFTLSSIFTIFIMAAFYAGYEGAKAYLEYYENKGNNNE